MAITSSLVSIILRYTFLAQQCETVSYWKPGGAAWLTATGAGGAEAWWNEVKDEWRATVPETIEATFDSVLLEEIGGSGAFGEFAIPTSERLGTRDGTGFGAFLPSFVAVGCRLSVATRATRPGQKRFPFAGEGDNAAGVVSSTFLGLVATVANLYSSTLIMGAPVATGILVPQVVHFPTTPDPTQRQQDVIGFVLRGTFTSQVSRKQGRGR